MPDEQGDVRDQLRDALGSIPEGAIVDRGEVKIEWPLALYTIKESTTTLQNLLFGKRCVSSRVLDVSGGGVTDANGTTTISLKAVTCVFGSPGAGQNFFNPSAPVNVVATPRTRTATHVTVRATVVAADRDVQIEVFSWDAQGQPAAQTPFHYRCTVELDEVVG
jgi:hypothetical protein